MNFNYNLAYCSKIKKCQSFDGYKEFVANIHGINFISIRANEDYCMILNDKINNLTSSTYKFIDIENFYPNLTILHNIKKS